MSNVYDMMNGVFVGDSISEPVASRIGEEAFPLLELGLQPLTTEVIPAYRMPADLAEVSIARFLASQG